MTKKIIISTIISTVLLFLWSGLTQIFPWGVPTAQTIASQTNKQTESFQTPNLIELPANSLTTNKFDEQFVNKISTLTTDKTFSWIVTKPVDYYNVGNYFIKEIITQLFVALLLATLLALTIGLPNQKRLAIIAIGGVLAVIAIYGQMMNWWGVPAIYALGAGLNLIIGWTLSAFVSSKFIIKPIA
jgi:Mg2+/citrate symporter